MAVKMGNFPEILNVIKCVAHSIPTYRLLISIQNPQYAIGRAIRTDCRLVIRPNKKEMFLVNHFHILLALH